MTTTQIGTSGWSYGHWDGVLYPPGLPPHERLARYVGAFRTAEVNSTFYRWPRAATFAGWRRRLPPGFVLSVKAPRGLTHGKRLYGPEVWLARLAEGLQHLGDRRGPLLVQLPPDQGDDPARLAYFLALVPSWLRVAVEFRHPSWHHEGTFALKENWCRGTDLTPPTAVGTRTHCGGCPLMRRGEARKRLRCAKILRLMPMRGGTYPHTLF